MPPAFAIERIPVKGFPRKLKAEWTVEITEYLRYIDAMPDDWRRGRITRLHFPAYRGNSACSGTP